jgi:hypothetical protein
MAYTYYAIAFAGLAVYFVVRQIQQSIRDAKFSKAHGCKPPHKFPQWDTITGYSMFRKQRKAAKEKVLLETNRARYGEHGLTWTACIMGNRFFSTIDPENVKAILATNFKDFGLGQREESFGPLLGKGIFTSDGAAWEHSRVSKLTSCPQWAFKVAS